MFRTLLDPAPSKNKINYQSEILTIGSCFADTIGKNLEKNKIILGYRIKCEFPDKMLFVILFTYKNLSRQKEKKVLTYLKETDQITASSRLFGKWDLLFYVYVDDNRQLQEILTEMRDQFEVLDRFKILPVFERNPVNFYPF